MVGGDALYRLHALEGEIFPHTGAVNVRFQLCTAHAVAHDAEVDIPAALCGKALGARDKQAKVLRGADVARKHHAKAPGKARRQRLVVHIPGVKVFAILRHHRHCAPRRNGAQLFAQRIAHAHKGIAAAVQPMRDARRNSAQRAVFYRQHRIEVFGPQVQHIGAKRHAVQLCIYNGGHHHQHRACLVTEHGVIVPPVQPWQAEQRTQRPGDIV